MDEQPEHAPLRHAHLGQSAAGRKVQSLKVNIHRLDVTSDLYCGPVGSGMSEFSGVATGGEIRDHKRAGLHGGVGRIEERRPGELDTSNTHLMLKHWTRVNACS